MSNFGYTATTQAEEATVTLLEGFGQKWLVFT